jgi:hypothetical protein
MVTGFGVAIVMIALALIAAILIVGMTSSTEGVVELVIAVSWWVGGGGIVGAVGFSVSSVSLRRRGVGSPGVATLGACVLSAAPSLILAAAISAAVSAITTPVPFPQSIYPEYNPVLAVAVGVIIIVSESLVGGMSWLVIDVIVGESERRR